MSEKLPNNPNRKREGPRLSFTFNDERYELRPDNAALFVHEDERYDHIYLRHTDNEWYRLFRAEMGNFDDVSEFMQSNGYQIHAKDAPLQQDFEVYHHAYGWDPIPELDELTPRQERKILFARYLLDREHVTPESFCDGAS